MGSSERVEELQWTGERFIPGEGGERLALEHLHRYAIARSLVRGSRVLDLGCGEGYGTSELIAGGALSVVSLDVDPTAVAHAHRRPDGGAPAALVADAMRLPFGSDVFDAVVCFEVIEHVTDPHALLAEVRRVLAPGGLLLVSTPNKSVYNAGREPNPFHCSEMELDEFRAALARQFSVVSLVAQRVVTCSTMWPIDSSPSTRGGFHASDPPEPEYVVACCTDGQRPLVTEPSTFTFWTDELRGLAEALDAAGQRETMAQRQLAEYERTVNEMADALRAAAEREAHAQRQLAVYETMIATSTAEAPPASGT